MQTGGLTTALAVTVLAGTASLALYAQVSARDVRPTGELIESSINPVSDGRIYLAADQIRETSNSRLWASQMQSLLQVDHTLRYGEWLWNDRGIPPGKATVRIDLTTQLISVVRGGHEIGTSVILYGAEGHTTPLGRFPILAKSVNYWSRTYDAPMPYAVRLTQDGVAIHGSDVQSGSATHGCIGLPLDFARKLFNQVEKGDQVLIIRS